MALIYTKTSSGRKKLDARQQRKLAEHKAYVAAILGGTSRKVVRTDTWDQPKGYVRQSNLPPVSNNLGTGGGFKRSIDDHKWKADRQESAATIKAIEAKKKQIAPAFSKGAYQYIPSESDVKTLGRKV